jgi:hypothetical protein
MAENLLCRRTRSGQSASPQSAGYFDINSIDCLSIFPTVEAARVGIPEKRVTAIMARHWLLPSVTPGNLDRLSSQTAIHLAASAKVYSAFALQNLLSWFALPSHDRRDFAYREELQIEARFVAAS